MSKAHENLLREALRLPESDRARMASALFESLDSEGRTDFESPSIDGAWKREAAARSAALDDGTVETHDWTVLRSRLWAELSVPDTD